jgi:hypothetical protein
MLKPSAPARHASDNSNLVQIMRLQAEISRLELAKKHQSAGVQVSIVSHIDQRRAAQLILYRQIYPESDSREFDAEARHTVATRLAEMSEEMAKTNKAMQSSKDDHTEVSHLGGQIQELHEGSKLLGAHE